MGFFIRDLHQQIEQLYKQALEQFNVYRGQGLSIDDFDNIHTKQGGLLSFQTFLSTSTDREFAVLYADSSRQDASLIGIVFEINIDPTDQSSVPFISLHEKISNAI